MSGDTVSRRDFLAAVEETYGRRPFTLRDLDEKGIPVPAGILRNRGIFVRVLGPGRRISWQLREGRS
ncbi:MAG TPA: hypothetical protein PKV78_04685 [Methanoculleus thermophilus]|nr:hypothetical protein [Methanoculleus thermophilus]